jgi:hypothetical protein
MRGAETGGPSTENGCEENQSDCDVSLWAIHPWAAISSRSGSTVSPVASNDGQALAEAPHDTQLPPIGKLGGSGGGVTGHRRISPPLPPEVFSADQENGGFSRRESPRCHVEDREGIAGVPTGRSLESAPIRESAAAS